MSSRLYRIGSGRAKEEKGKKGKARGQGFYGVRECLIRAFLTNGGKRRREKGRKRRFIEERDGRKQKEN